MTLYLGKIGIDVCDAYFLTFNAFPPFSSLVAPTGISGTAHGVLHSPSFVIVDLGCDFGEAYRMASNPSFGMISFSLMALLNGEKERTV